MGSVTEIKFTGTCSSDITTAEADSYRNNVCKQFMAVEGRRLTIEIHVDDKTNQLTLSFHNAAEQIVQRFKVENPEFYRLAREYRSAVTICWSFLVITGGAAIALVRKLWRQ